jgi:hypothetical protein
MGGEMVSSVRTIPLLDATAPGVAVGRQYRAVHRKVYDWTKQRLGHRLDEDIAAKFDISTTSGTARNRVAVAAEIEKCDIVCANCHRVRTKRRGDALRAERRRRLYGAVRETA